MNFVALQRVGGWEQTINIIITWVLTSKVTYMLKSNHSTKFSFLYFLEEIVKLKNEIETRQQ